MSEDESYITKQLGPLIKKRRERVFIDVTDHQREQLNRIPKEYRGLFLSAIITDMIAALEEQGMDFVVSVIKKDLDIKDRFATEEDLSNG